MDGYWIATGLAATGGQLVLGPFESKDLALRVRSYVERADGRKDLWVLGGADLCGFVDRVEAT